MFYMKIPWNTIWCSPFWLACRSPCDHCGHSSVPSQDTLLFPACTAVPWNQDGRNTPRPRSPHGWSSPCSWNHGPGSFHSLQTPPASGLWSTSPRRTLSGRRRSDHQRKNRDFDSATVIGGETETTWDHSVRFIHHCEHFPSRQVSYSILAFNQQSMWSKCKFVWATALIILWFY